MRLCRHAGMLVMVLALGACGADSADTPSASERHSIGFGDYLGVQVYGQASFAVDRQLLGARLLIGNAVGDVLMYGPDYDDTEDGEIPPQHITLEAGQEVSFDADITPECVGDAAPAVVEFSYRASDDSVATERVVVSSEQDVAVPVRRFCDAGVQAKAGSSHVDPRTDGWQEYWLVNPGPGDVTVTSVAFERQGVSWSSSSVQIPAGEEATLKVSGEGPITCGTPSPLHLGLLRVEGGLPEVVVRDESSRGLC